MEEDALGTLLFGKAKSIRRFDGDMCKGIPTKEKMMEFWGDALLNMPQVAKKKHVDKGTIYVNNKAASEARGCSL